MGTVILLARRQAELPALKTDMFSDLSDLDSGERPTVGKQYLEGGMRRGLEVAAEPNPV
jgi:hypothetical protein